jgi:para-aminobenzoate synthetase component 1
MLSFLSRTEAEAQMNQLGTSNTAFFFILSFDLEHNWVIPQSEWAAFPFGFDFPTLKHTVLDPRQSLQSFDLRPQLPEFSIFQKQFQQVQYHLRRGDSYLINLTFEVPILLQDPLEQVFLNAEAPYKLFLKDHFTSFSPECFVKIQQDQIFTYPMKGTISTSVPDAADRILGDEKETAEHYTIVDLLRNDLSQIGYQTQVQKFRFLSNIKKRDQELLQVSSEISARLPSQWQQEIGSLLFRLLPAGSISGAPKQKTVEIIAQTESHSRDWYTGVAGWYKDGELDSAVLIRYIGHRDGHYHYKTGGGITLLSDPQKEYQELAEKIYIPTA